MFLRVPHVPTRLACVVWYNIHYYATVLCLRCARYITLYVAAVVLEERHDQPAGTTSRIVTGQGARRVELVSTDGGGTRPPNPGSQ
jgi:hypothetical protein